MYPVGNLAAFMSSTSSAPSDTKYEITLRYVEIVETAPAAP